MKVTQKEKDLINHEKSPSALKSTYKITQNGDFVKPRCSYGY